MNYLPNFDKSMIEERLRLASMRREIEKKQIQGQSRPVHVEDFMDAVAIELPEEMFFFYCKHIPGFNPNIEKMSNVTIDTNKRSIVLRFSKVKSYGNTVPAA